MKSITKVEKKTMKEAIRENPWILATFVLGAICLSLLLFTGIKNEETAINKPQVEEGFSYDPILGDLIPKEVVYIYSSDCGWCKKQKEYFRESSWNKYIESNLTIDCAKEENKLCSQISGTPSWFSSNPKGIEFITSQFQNVLTNEDQTIAIASGYKEFKI